MPAVRLFDETALRRVLRPEAVLAAIDAGFRLPPVPAAAQFTADHGDAATVTGRLPGIPAYTVRSDAMFPGSDPADRGMIMLHNAGDGRLLAILHGPLITALGSGAAAAIGTHVLARGDAATVAFIGCGAQAAVVLRMLRRLRPLTALLAHDPDQARAEGFAARARALGLAADACGLADAAGADIVIATTGAAAPFLYDGMIRPGTHLTTLGPGKPGRAEAGDDLLRRVRVVVDDARLHRAAGAIGSVALGPCAIADSLTDVVTGAAEGRRDAAEITVFSALGLPWQDLALAWIACESGGGVPFDVGG